MSFVWDLAAAPSLKSVVVTSPATVSCTVWTGTPSKGEVEHLSCRMWMSMCAALVPEGQGSFWQPSPGLLAEQLGCA